MIEKRYRNIVYFIAVTIVVTIAVQIYWNIKNFEMNKRQISNQVQVSFDAVVDNYYTGLAKRRVVSLVSADYNLKNNPILIRKSHDSTIIKWTKRVEVSRQLNSDFGVHSNIIVKRKDSNKLSSNVNPISSFYQITLNGIDPIENLSLKILTSLNKELNLEQIDSLFAIDLKLKELPIKYGFKYTSSLRESNFEKEYRLENFPIAYLNTFAQSSFLPNYSKLELRYTDMTGIILKRMLGSIILSLFLSGVIIGCLLFLLQIIFKQKQLSEIKNDLISNITHEFKTPIATVSVALEGLQNFNVLENPEKAKEYLKLSLIQLDSLNLMVEKILETATLKTDQFNLNKEKININKLLKNCIEKFQFTTEKEISFKSESDICINIDKFHFENAINNILDNAIKYGGSTINVILNSKGEITIEDNGSGIPKKLQERIFEQFYRIPKGNIHNIKGFGIGLYYAREIFNKHGASIEISESKKGKTVFKIRLENE